MKLCCILPESFWCMQGKLEFLSPNIVSALKYEELISHFRVYKNMQQVHKRKMSNDRRAFIHWSFYEHLKILWNIYGDNYTID